MSDGPTTSEIGLDQETATQPIQPEVQALPEEDTRPRSEILLERLDKLVEEEPDKYTPETRSNVWQFIHNVKRKEAYPNIKLQWNRYFENLEDYKLYYELNTEMHSLTTAEMHKSNNFGSRGFYYSLKRFLEDYRKEEYVKYPEFREEIDIEKAQMRDELFAKDNKGWSSFTTLEDWKKYMEDHNLSGLSTREVKTHEGGNAFYQAFLKFVKGYRADEYESNPELRDEIDTERKSMRIDLFEPKRNDWSSFTNFEQWREYMSSNRLLGLSYSEIQDKENGNAAYQAFNKFINNYRADEYESNPEQRDEIDAERKAMMGEVLSPLQQDWKSFTTLEQWRDYAERNGLTEMSIYEIVNSSDGNLSFYTAFRKYVKNFRADEYESNPELKDEIETERKLMMEEILPSKKKDWSSYTTFEQWKDYMVKNNLSGLSASELQNHDGGNAFYIAFSKFVKGYRAEEYDTQPELRKEIEAERNAMREEIYIKNFKKQYEFNGKKIDFDSSPERTVAILLHKYGLLDKPLDKLPYGVAEESSEHKINVHFGINDDRRNSFDFLTDSGDMIEYHPVYWASEKPKGYDESNVLDERIGHVTREEYAGKPVYHIWELDQLYDIIIDPELNLKLDPSNIPTKDEFEEAIEEAKEQARQYDLEKEKEEQVKEDLKKAA